MPTLWEAADAALADDRDREIVRDPKTLGDLARQGLDRGSGRRNNLPSPDGVGARFPGAAGGTSTHHRPTHSSASLAPTSRLTSTNRRITWLRVSRTRRRST